MSRAPAPVAKGSPTAAFRADSISRAFTVAGFSEGSFSSSSAAAPATMGAAMLVPDSSKYALFQGWVRSPAIRLSGNWRSRVEPVDRVDQILLPGARRSGLATRLKRAGPRDE